MASKVYEIVELELQDGTVIEIRPLPIKRLRKFMNVIEKMSQTPELDEQGNLVNEQDQDKMVDYLLDAAQVALEAKWPQYKDRETLEEAVDLPTLMKICEVAGGLNFSGDADPNLLSPLGAI